MRILWLNPIGTAEHDAAMAAALAAAKRPDTTAGVTSFTPGRVPAHLEYDGFEAFAVPEIVRAARHFSQEGWDAMVVGCFYDTALEAAREVSGDMIVVGPCQAGLEVAGALAAKASILATRAKAAGHIARRVRGYGAGDRIASIRTLDILTSELTRDPGLTARRVEEEARAAIERDGAEAILLGCTLEYEAAAAIGRRLGVPLIDAVRAPFAQAEALARLARDFGWGAGRVRAGVAPSAAEMAETGCFVPPPLNPLLEVVR
ncbi:MAG: hydantoin racemase [Rhodovulum sulfidophilum]|uniref:Hydantoin racemase n=1 Tax=Rhodovulum sulfidophilum TaxID=35806 RepID=A0A2W5N6B5_RHOSU|nr:MAG: hydantoin racemase [Rhodovulum sulfidophilum]